MPPAPFVVVCVQGLKCMLSRHPWQPRIPAPTFYFSSGRATHGSHVIHAHREEGAGTLPYSEIMCFMRCLMVMPS